MLNFGRYRKPYTKVSAIKTEGQILSEARAKFRKEKGLELNTQLGAGMI